MSLPKQLENKDQIPEGMEAAYAECGGKWCLNEPIAQVLDEHERAINKGRDEINALRQSNVSILKETDEIRALVGRFRDIDVDLLRQARELSEAQALKSGDPAQIERCVTGPLRRAYEEKIAALQSRSEAMGAEAKKRDEEIERLDREIALRVIDGEVRNLAIAAGARPEAMDDIVRRARLGGGSGSVAFRLEDGKAVSYSNGSPYLDSETMKPMSLKKWVDCLAKSAPHLFKENRGSGASSSGGHSSSVSSGPNPYKRGSGFNLTKQAQLEMNDPGLAHLFKQQAGIQI